MESEYNRQLLVVNNYELCSSIMHNAMENFGKREIKMQPNNNTHGIVDLKWGKAERGFLENMIN